MDDILLIKTQHYFKIKDDALPIESDESMYLFVSNKMFPGIQKTPKQIIS